MSSKSEQETINKRREEIKAMLRLWKFELDKLQKRCKHPNLKLTTSHAGGSEYATTGNCPDCDFRYMD